MHHKILQFPIDYVCSFGILFPSKNRSLQEKYLDFMNFGMKSANSLIFEANLVIMSGIPTVELRAATT